MSLITVDLSKKDLTLEQKQQKTKQSVQRAINNLFMQMITVYRDNIDMIFDNPYHLTKEQVIASFGIDAIELIRLGTLLKDVINIAVPGTIKTPADEYNSEYSA